MMICFGHLCWGVAPYGLSYLGLDGGLGSGWWSHASRLSEYQTKKQRHAFRAAAKINNLMPRASKN